MIFILLISIKLTADSNFCVYRSKLKEHKVCFSIDLHGTNCYSTQIRTLARRINSYANSNVLIIGRSVIWAWGLSEKRNMVTFPMFQPQCKLYWLNMSLAQLMQAPFPVVHWLLHMRVFMRLCWRLDFLSSNLLQVCWGLAFLAWNFVQLW